MKMINFKQPKYMLPLILYLPILFVGYMLIKTFHTETADTADPRLKTTDYLSSELPEANTDSVLGSKMDNTEDMYGKISDLSGVENVENDNDSVNKKQDYESRYSEREANQLAQQQAEQEEKRKLQAMQNRVRQERRSRSTSSNDFVAPVSDSEIARVQRMRRQRNWEEMDRDLSGNSSNNYMAGSGGSSTGSSSSSISYDEEGNPIYNNPNSGSYNGMPGHGNGGSTNNHAVNEEAPEKVVKKTKQTSDYFNTIGGSNKQSKLITAIIDENVKAVDGSRVRLRLLDDVEIGDVTVRKGTYLYAIMSGFGKQRVNGKVESVFYNEEIIKVSLSIFDTDGLEGLYVPISQFRETAQDVVSSAMQGSNIIDNSSTTGSGGIKNWANTAVQNASQRVMSALGSAAKKNRVRLKYGTKVYLVDESQKQGKSARNNR